MAMSLKELAIERKKAGEDFSTLITKKNQLIIEIKSLKTKLSEKRKEYKQSVENTALKQELEKLANEETKLVGDLSDKNKDLSTTKKNIENKRKQLQMIGTSYNSAEESLKKNPPQESKTANAQKPIKNSAASVVTTPTAQATESIANKARAEMGVEVQKNVLSVKENNRKELEKKSKIAEDELRTAEKNLANELAQITILEAKRQESLEDAERTEDEEEKEEEKKNIALNSLEQARKDVDIRREDQKKAELEKLDAQAAEAKARADLKSAEESLARKEHELATKEFDDLAAKESLAISAQEGAKSEVELAQEKVNETYKKFRTAFDTNQEATEVLNNLTSKETTLWENKESLSKSINETKKQSELLNAQIEYLATDDPTKMVEAKKKYQTLSLETDEVIEKKFDIPEEGVTKNKKIESLKEELNNLKAENEKLTELTKKNESELHDNQIEIKNQKKQTETTKTLLESAQTTLTEANKGLLESKEKLKKANNAQDEATQKRENSKKKVDESSKKLNIAIDATKAARTSEKDTLLKAGKTRADMHPPSTTPSPASKATEAAPNADTPSPEPVPDQHADKDGDKKEDESEEAKRWKEYEEAKKKLNGEGSVASMLMKLIELYTAAYNTRTSPVEKTFQPIPSKANPDAENDQSHDKSTSADEKNLQSSQSTANPEAENVQSQDTLISAGEKNLRPSPSTKSPNNERDKIQIEAVTQITAINNNNKFGQSSQPSFHQKQTNQNVHSTSHISLQ